MREAARQSENALDGLSGSFGRIAGWASAAFAAVGVGQFAAEPDRATVGLLVVAADHHRDHVGVAVPDLDDAIAFYRDALGMALLHEETNEEQGVREAMMAVGDSGSCIQLLAPLSEESTIAKFIDRNGPGLQQVAYRVTDVAAAADTLRIGTRAGMRTVEPSSSTAVCRGTPWST
mgnify:CR=1 FL=1